MNIKEIDQFRIKIRKLERDIERQMESEGDCCGVTLAQCHTLLELEHMEKTSIKELADYLELDKSTLSRTIDTLVNQGLVERVINKDDRRYMEITLTEEGREKCNGINKICNAFYMKVIDQIPKSKQKSVLDGLSLFIDAIYKTKNAQDILKIKCCSK